jgi:hypothetical protein
MASRGALVSWVRMLHYFDGSFEIALSKGIPFVKAFPLGHDAKSVGFFNRLQLCGGRKEDT